MTQNWKKGGLNASRSKPSTNVLLFSRACTNNHIRMLVLKSATCNCRLPILISTSNQQTSDFLEEKQNLPRTMISTSTDGAKEAVCDMSLDTPHAPRTPCS